MSNRRRLKPEFSRTDPCWSCKGPLDGSKLILPASLEAGYVCRDCYGKWL